MILLLSSYSPKEPINPVTDALLISPHANTSANIPVMPSSNLGR
jgi:hypothetical protein